MAVITASNLTQGYGESITSITSASISPTAGTLLICGVKTHSPTSNNLPAVTVSGNSLTWTQIATYTNVNEQNSSTTLFRAAAISPTAGAVTIASLSPTDRIGYTIDQFSHVVITGTNGSDGVIQAASGGQNTNSTGFSLTLSAFQNINNVAYGFVINDQDSRTISSGSGFTELSQAGSNGNQESEWKVNATIVNWTWTAPGGNMPTQGIAIEIKALIPSGFFSFL